MQDWTPNGIKKVYHNRTCRISTLTCALLRQTACKLHKKAASLLLVGRWSFYIPTAKERLATMCAKQLKKYKLKYIIKLIHKKDSIKISTFIQKPQQAIYVHTLSHLQ